MSSKTQVLIVGAGPTGLALACHLQRLGIAIRLIDQKPGPSTTSKAIGLQYRVSEILACMGVADRFLTRSGNPTAVNINSGGRRLVQLKFAGSKRQSGRDAFEPTAIMIPQSETESILGDSVRERGGHIEWDTQFLNFEQDVTKVISHLKRPDGEEEKVEADWLVSCEGVHSAIRKQAGIAFVGKTYPLAFFLADVELEGPLNHRENYVWLHADGSFAALPLPKPKTWRLFVDVTQIGDATASSGGLTLEMIRQLMLTRTGETGMQIGHPTWISEFRIHCRIVDHYRAGRVFLAGDAAHAHSPTGGRGIVTGIQDATNLGWKLARVIRGAPQSLLDTYEEERLPKAQEVLKETDRTTTLLLAPSMWTRLFRDFVLLPIMRNAWVQTKLFAKLAQLHVNYRDSSLSQQQDASLWFSRSGLQAGDRAPDVAFQRAGSLEITTLFQLLQPMKPLALIGVTDSLDRHLLASVTKILVEADIDFHLLGVHNSESEHEGVRLIDLHGDFRRLYGLAGDFLCLIRPDDHIGLVQRPINAPALSRYLCLLSSHVSFPVAW